MLAQRSVRPSWRPAGLALLASLATACLALLAAPRPSAAPERASYRSPLDAAFAPDGRLLAVSDATAGHVVLMDGATGRVMRRVALPEPAGLTWDPSGTRLYAAGRWGVAAIDPAAGAIVRRYAVAPRPVGLALAPRRGLLLAAGAHTRALSIVDLPRGAEVARIACPGELFGVAVTPDETTAVAGSLLPLGDASDAGASASLTLVDLRTLRRTGAVRLPAGSTAVRGLAVSPDGRWAYAVHTVGRFTLPTSQLDRGWVNTNALSIVDLRGRKVHATVLLDHPSEGAADPWGIALSRDGAAMWVTLSGVHELARIDLVRLHALIDGKLPDDHPLVKAADEFGSTARSIWVSIKRDPAQRAELVNDLAAMNVADLMERTPLKGQGPRGLALSPDGQRVVAAMYFSGALDVADASTGRVMRRWSLGPSAAPDAVRAGERMFHDATLCFQRWLSCATCHPGGRADGLNWDLLNDGLGNPKNTRSMLLAHRRGHMMSHGIRENMDVASLAGFRFILFREPEKGEVAAVRAYIRSLAPVRSPYRLGAGTLSPAARRGKAVFESARTKCATCHKGPLHTDLKLYDVGTRRPMDTSGRFITPTLVEVWRTAPYLHDGSAVSMLDVLTLRNRGDRHGVTSHLTEAETRDLAEYVMSL